MMKWVSNFGEEFETKEEARDDAGDKMEWSDYIERLEASISWIDLFKWAREQDGFYDRFNDEFLEAEDDFFTENYHEEECDEEEEE